MRADLPEMSDHLLGGDVPAAVVARGDRRVAAGAVERAAVQELLDALLLDAGEALGSHREGDRVLALLAGPGVVLGDQRLEVIVDTAGNDPAADAQRAVHPELREDRPADELALVGQLIEEL